MAKPGRMKEILAAHGEEGVVRKLNEHGTIEGAARELQIGFRALWQWTQRQRLQKRVHWSLPEPHDHGAN